jgi:predicted nucleic acid-binding protein
VDASALLASAEPGRDDLAAAGEALAGGVPLMAPALLAWEVANVVHAKRPEAFGADVAARRALVALLLDGIVLHPPTPAHLLDVARLAHEHRLSAYDAAYLALAVSHRAILVTEDAKLHRAAAKELGATRAWRLLDAMQLVAEDEWNRETDSMAGPGPAAPARARRS